MALAHDSVNLTCIKQRPSDIPGVNGYSTSSFKTDKLSEVCWAIACTKRNMTNCQFNSITWQMSELLPYKAVNIHNYVSKLMFMF